jgi:hypothetical protein
MLGLENECGHVHHHNAGEGEGGEGRRQEDTGGIVRVMERRQEPNFSANSRLQSDVVDSHARLSVLGLRTLQTTSPSPLPLHLREVCPDAT